MSGSKELVRATLGGGTVPRYPAGPLAVHYCARFAGASVRQYTSDAAVLAESVIRYYERFRPDAVWLSADTWVNAQAMAPGSKRWQTACPGAASAAPSSGRSVTSSSFPSPMSKHRGATP